MRFEHEPGDGAVTEEDRIDRTSPGVAVDFCNGSDDDTYGTGAFGIIRERVERSVVVENPYDLDAQDGIRIPCASGRVHQAALLDRVPDDRAQAVVAQTAHHADCPELRQFATRGWGDRQRMTPELDDAHVSW